METVLRSTPTAWGRIGSARRAARRASLEQRIERLERDTNARDATLEMAIRFDPHMAIGPDCVRYLLHHTETVKAGRLATGNGVTVEVPDDLVAAILKARRS